MIRHIARKRARGSSARRKRCEGSFSGRWFPSRSLAVACKGDKPATSTMTEDLKRDLQLASATQNIQISPDEIAPKSQQELAVRPKKAPNGPKVVRTEKPTVKASVDSGRSRRDQDGHSRKFRRWPRRPPPSESPTADAPPLARPAPVPVRDVSVGGGDSGGERWKRRRWHLAGVFGAVIRGGRVGDDDHCDPRPRRGCARRPQTGQRRSAAASTHRRVIGIGMPADGGRTPMIGGGVDKSSLKGSPVVGAGCAASFDFGRTAPRVVFCAVNGCPSRDRAVIYGDRTLPGTRRIEWRTTGSPRSANTV